MYINQRFEVGPWNNNHRDWMDKAEYINTAISITKEWYAEHWPYNWSVYSPSGRCIARGQDGELDFAKFKAEAALQKWIESLRLLAKGEDFEVV